MLVRKSHKAWRLRSSGDHEGALAAFKRAGRKFSYEIGVPAHGKGACLIALGRPAEAEEPLRQACTEYQQALRRHRSDDDLLFYLAGAQALLGDHQAALTTLARYQKSVHGLRDPMKYVREDPDFANLADDPQFHALVAPESSEQRQAREAQERQKEADKALKLDYREMASFDSYLARLVFSRFKLAADRVGKAHRRLVERVDRLGDASFDLAKEFVDQIAHSRSLEGCFEKDQLQRDAAGNVVGFHAGADEWATLVPLIEQFADLVEPDSLLLFLDDEGYYWKVEFVGGQLRRSRSRRKKR